MYAIIKTGGKQHRVALGDTIDVELLPERTGPVEFKEVLLVHDGQQTHVGQPNLPHFPVRGNIIETALGDKVTALKYKRSHTQCRKWGHRQKYSRVVITEIGSHKQHQEGNHGT